MCFAEPGQVVSTNGSMARLATAGGDIDVSLAVLHARGEHVAVGDWIVAALGLALESVAEPEGRRLLDERCLLLQVVEQPRAGQPGVGQPRVGQQGLGVKGHGVRGVSTDVG
jgi:hydrogenase maturation factor